MVLTSHHNRVAVALCGRVVHVHHGVERLAGLGEELDVFGSASGKEVVTIGVLPC